MENACPHLKELLEAQLKIMKRHVARHKWFNHIENEDDAYQDFVTKFAWIMRELYCESACPDRDKCEFAKNLERVDE